MALRPVVLANWESASKNLLRLLQSVEKLSSSSSRAVESWRNLVKAPGCLSRVLVKSWITDTMPLATVSISVPQRPTEDGLASRPDTRPLKKSPALQADDKLRTEIRITANFIFLLQPLLFWTFIQQGLEWKG